MRRRLLLLAHFFPPLAGGGVHRVLSFVRHLPAHGWDCTVVCAGEDDYWVRDESLLAQRAARDRGDPRRAAAARSSAWLRLRGGAGRRRAADVRGPARARRTGGCCPIRTSAGRGARRARGARAHRRGRHRRGALDLAARQRAPGRGATSPRARAAVGRGLSRSVDRALLPHAAHARGTARARRRWSAACSSAPTSCSTASRTHLDALGRGERRARAPRRAPAERIRARRRPRRDEAPDPDHFRLVFTGTLSLMADTATLLEAVHDVLARTARGAAPAARRPRGAVRPRVRGPRGRARADRHRAILRARSRTPSRARCSGARTLLLLWKPRGEGSAPWCRASSTSTSTPADPCWRCCPRTTRRRRSCGAPGGEVLPPGRSRANWRARSKRGTWRGSRQGARRRRAPGVARGARARALAARLAARLDALAGERLMPVDRGPDHADRVDRPRGRAAAGAGAHVAAARLPHRRHVHPPAVRAEPRRGARLRVQRRRARLRQHEPAVGGAARGRDDARTSTALVAAHVLGLVATLASVVLFLAADAPQRCASPSCARSPRSRGPRTRG